MSETADNFKGSGHNGHLTSGRLLAKNTVWNLLGSGAPMIVAGFCISILIKRLGTDRFGGVTLAWAPIGGGRLVYLGVGGAAEPPGGGELGGGEEREDS